MRAAWILQNIAQDLSTLARARTMISRPALGGAQIKPQT
jgi:hypothetical protein